MSYNPQQPINLPQLPHHQQQPQQLLLISEPHDELIDFGEINGFLRDKHDQLAHSLAFDNHADHLQPHQMNFDEKHTHQRNHFHQHQLLQEHHHNYVHSHVENQHSQYPGRQQQQDDQHDQHIHSEEKRPTSQPRRKCICKKTQCLKMYCQCFASNLPCTEQCTCLSCKNTLQHQKEITQAKLLIQQKGVVGLHSCSLSQKRCNCKKSGCLKKYCECYNSGVKCSEGCKCIQCKNCQNSHNDNEKKPVDAVKVTSKGKKEKKQKKAFEISHN